jgi:hypothetical protein
MVQLTWSQQGHLLCILPVGVVSVYSSTLILPQTAVTGNGVQGSDCIVTVDMAPAMTLPVPCILPECAVGTVSLSKTGSSTQTAFVNRVATAL